jgi:archaellum biogenesis protein FlaJ (TadC family)
MSFREKSAWISFVSILVVFSAYFWNVARILHGKVDGHTGFVISIALLAAFVLIEIVLHLTVIMQAPNEARAPRDEREQLIELKATRVAFQVLVVGALAGVGMMHITRNAFVVGQHVLLAIVFAELVKFGVQIRYFRGGV